MLVVELSGDLVCFLTAEGLRRGDVCCLLLLAEVELVREPKTLRVIAFDDGIGFSPR